MSQLVLDDQLDVQIILPRLEGWITAVRLQDLRPGEHVLDDRVPEILQTLKTPTFVTIDHGFWNRRLCHPDYCILYLEQRIDEQEQLPALLRRLTGPTKGTVGQDSDSVAPSFAVISCTDRIGVLSHEDVCRIRQR